MTTTATQPLRKRRKKIVRRIVSKPAPAAEEESTGYVGVDDAIETEADPEAEVEAAEAPVEPARRVAKKVAPAKGKANDKKVKKTKQSEFREKWTGPANIRAQTSGVLRGFMDEAAKEFGDPDICTAGDAGRLIVGLRFPCFALEYLFQNTVLALGRVMQLLGVEGTCKSGIACEFGRWFIAKYGGLVGLKEHESKYSPDWTMSIIGWENGDSFGHIPCNSVDEWQARQLWFLNKIKRQMLGTESDKGPGMVYPVLSIVDSLMGKSLAESQARIDKAGFAGRDFAVEAQSITKYMRHIPQKIRQWPFFIILVNHEKPHKDDQGKTVRDKAGGRGKEFQETYEISMSRIRRLKAATYDGMDLEMRLHKNSLGVTDRRIPITVRWWDEPNPNDPDGPWRQNTVFDWHGSTIKLLLKMSTAKDSDKAKLRSVMDLQMGKNQTVYSKALGISKDSPLSFYEAGLALNENEQVLKGLRQVFGIKARKEFDGTDYRKQLGDEKRKIVKKLTLK